MSEPLRYTPPVAPVSPSPQDEFSHLLAVLSEKGIIARVTQALEGASDAGSVLLTHADTPRTRATLEVVVRYVQLLGDLDPVIVEGISAGFKRAGRAKETPTWRDLARRVADPQVRRGLGVLLHVVAGLGESKL